MRNANLDEAARLDDARRLCKDLRNFPRMEELRDAAEICRLEALVCDRRHIAHIADIFGVVAGVNIETNTFPASKVRGNILTLRVGSDVKYPTRGHIPVLR
jgi:hypothetical protein